MTLPPAVLKARTAADAALQGVADAYGTDKPSAVGMILRDLIIARQMRRAVRRGDTARAVLWGAIMLRHTIQDELTRTRKVLVDPPQPDPFADLIAAAARQARS